MVLQLSLRQNYRPKTGLNAPLDDAKAPADSKQQYSIKKSIKYWTDAKVPAKKVCRRPRNDPILTESAAPQLQIALPAYAKIFRTAGTDLTDSDGTKAYQAKQMPLQAPAAGQEGNVKAGEYDKQGPDGCGVWRDFGATFTVRRQDLANGRPPRR